MFALGECANKILLRNRKGMTVGRSFHDRTAWWNVEMAIAGWTHLSHHDWRSVYPQFFHRDRHARLDRLCPLFRYSLGLGRALETYGLSISDPEDNFAAAGVGHGGY